MWYSDHEVEREEKDERQKKKKKGLFIDDGLLDVRPFSSSNNALLTECK